MDTVVVVGASLGGLRTAEFLRRGGFAGRLVLVGDEEHLPYDRPPLSKEVLRAEWTPDRIALRRKSYDELGAELLLGTRATGLDLDLHAVELSSGHRVGFDALVIATGARARRLPSQPSLAGLFTLRTLDDAIAIRDAMKDASRIAVIGAGFIGAEVAASARQLGLEVAMIEALATPLEQSLGPDLGQALAEVHARRGVRLHCGHRVARFVGDRRVEGVVLEDATRIPCDVCVVGVGVDPEVSWLKESGLELEDGVRCDEACRASANGIVAVGDVASWYNPLFEEQMRVEHWTNAVEQARHAARTLLEPSDPRPFAAVPMFWSDQYEIKIQGAGRPRADDDLRICGGSLEDEQFVALYSRGGRPVGVITFNQPAKLVQLRRLIAQRGTLEDALRIADS